MFFEKERNHDHTSKATAIKYKIRRYGKDDSSNKTSPAINRNMESSSYP